MQTLFENPIWAVKCEITRYFETIWIRSDVKNIPSTKIQYKILYKLIFEMCKLNFEKFFSTCFLVWLVAPPRAMSYRCHYPSSQRGNVHKHTDKLSSSKKVIHDSECFQYGKLFLLKNLHWNKCLLKVLIYK